MTRIAIDAMGGDNAPAEIIKGAVNASKEITTFEFSSHHLYIIVLKFQKQK